MIFAFICSNYAFIRNQVLASLTTHTSDLGIRGILFHKLISQRIKRLQDDE